MLAELKQLEQQFKQIINKATDSSNGSMQTFSKELGIVATPDLSPALNARRLIPTKIKVTAAQEKILNVLLNAIKDFEDLKFVKIKFDDENNNYTIELSRYNLTLVTKKVNGVWQIFLPDSNYTLISNPPSVIEGLKTPLYFLDQTANKQILLLPKQPFFVRTQQDNPNMPVKKSEYFVLEPDLSQELNQDPTINLSSNNYHGTASYAAYIVKDSLPVPQNLEEGLYLCYVYICKQETTKAFDLLEKIEHDFGLLSGKNKELEFIYFIAKPNQSNSFTKQIKTPNLIAIQLKALSLWARSAINGSIDKDEVLTKYIISIYFDYLIRYNKVQDDLKLKATEELALLDALFLLNPNSKKYDIKERLTKLK